MPEPVKGNGRYMAGLDGLRALAVLAVIAYHLNLSIAPGGLLGVGVFFVLSGYLITDLLVAEWQGNRQINLKNFWLRRARRLLPALCIMLVAVGGWVTLFDRAQLAALRGDVLAAPWERVVNTTLAQVAATYPHTTLVDWYAASAGHASFFSPDGVHLAPAGAQFYANLVAGAVQPHKD
ncbi:hypothetical protein hamaS1_26600 [Moorella sp. Hama-1]|nr:acyltransferase family protein [Moorella sp. Hama-1]BCV22591.1 hypothetical protein hamaS1_26600 [Moorella sp. Hama-1]